MYDQPIRLHLYAADLVPQCLGHCYLALTDKHSFPFPLGCPAPIYYQLTGYCLKLPFNWKSVLKATWNNI